MHRSASLTSVLIAGLLALPAMAAPPEGKAKNKHPKDAPAAVQLDADIGRGLVSVSIRSGDARRIAERHGYVGYAGLPPGIRKNLARGKPLPPGIAKKMVPGPMLRELPVYGGYEWRVYGTDLVLVALASGVIADVLSGVFD
jgi:Ni/Co efflux regulator RcnB